MHNETQVRHVCLTGKSPAQSRRWFLKLEPEEMERFVRSSPKGRFDLLVWMLLLNAQRVTQSVEIKFTPRWWQSSKLDQRQVRDSLRHLASVGLVEVNSRRGKSPLVRLLPKVESEQYDRHSEKV